MTKHWDCLDEYKEEHVAQMLEKVEYHLPHNAGRSGTLSTASSPQE